MTKPKIFFSDVSGSHYRKGIFTLLDKHYEIDWCFGIGPKSLAKLDDKLLKNVKRVRITKFFLNWYWQGGIVSSLWKKYDYYVLDGELYSVSAWLFLILNKLFFLKKVYLWSHGWYGRESGIKKLLKSIFFPLASGSFFYGNHAKEVMRESGLNVDDIVVIHNSLDYDNQKPLRTSCNKTDALSSFFKNEFPNLIFIGRLTFSKKLNMILEAALCLRKMGMDVNITFVGIGEALNDLRNQAKEKGINCYFYGECYNEAENARLISSADICISPGNVGLTAIHSLMFGTPVITHNNFSNQGPEVESVLEGKTGMLFDEGNIESLAKSIYTWLSHVQDRSIIRENCYKEIDSYWNPEYQYKVFAKVIPTDE